MLDPAAGRATESEKFEPSPPVAEWVGALGIVVVVAVAYPAPVGNELVLLLDNQPVSS
jgi:hypothetical protein